MLFRKFFTQELRERLNQKYLLISNILCEFFEFEQLYI